MQLHLVTDTPDKGEKLINQFKEAHLDVSLHHLVDCPKLTADDCDCVMLDIPVHAISQVPMSSSSIAKVLLVEHSQLNAAAGMVEHDHIFDYIDTDDWQTDRITTILQQAKRHKQLMSQLTSQQETIKTSSDHDHVTQLPTRLSLEKWGEASLAQARRYQRVLAFLFIDLDKFKHINTALGHDKGDEILKMVADRLSQCIRGSDMLGRLGGDQFGIILPEISHTFDAGRVAKKVIQALQIPFKMDGENYYLAVSVGIACYPDVDESLSVIMQSAYEAVLQAREQSQQNYQYYSKQLNQNHRKRLTIENALRTAVDNQELRLVYQPQYDLGSRKMIGMEALVRWQNPQLGFIPPDEMIPVAEETGLIHPIGHWILKTACEQFQNWRLGANAKLQLGINVSPKQLNDESIAQEMIRIIKYSQLPCEQIELELTESVIMPDNHKAEAILTHLHDNGIRIAIDDFGTGTSSLSRIRCLPLDTLKIDRSFIMELHSNEHDAKLVRSIIDLGKNMDMSVIAEGIESEKHVDFLAKHGCLLGQGYFFSKPIETQDMTRLLLAE